MDKLDDKLRKILPNKFTDTVDTIGEKTNQFADNNGPRYHTSVDSLDSSFGDSSILRDFVDEKIRSSENFISAINYSTGKTTTSGMLVLTDKRVLACTVFDMRGGSTEAESIRLDSISSIDTEDELTNVGIGGGKTKLNIKASEIDNVYEVYTQADIEQFVDDCWAEL